jgi:hypothetical protein
MMRPRACYVAVLLTLGCRSAEEPPAAEDQAIDPGLAYEQEPDVPTKPADTPTVEPEPDEPVFFVEIDEEPELEPENEPTNDEAPRDLAAELNAAVGIPSDCVRDFEASGRSTLRINVSATVRPSGVIILPEAFGSGLTNDARQCIMRRVGAVVLKPLDSEVSQRVSTIIEIDYVPPVIFESDRSVPEPQLRNVRQPLPPRPEIAPSGTPIQEQSGSPIQEPTSRPIQEPSSRKIRGPKPRPIDGYEVDENAKEWR